MNRVNEQIKVVHQRKVTRSGEVISYVVLDGAKVGSFGVMDTIFTATPAEEIASVKDNVVIRPLSGTTPVENDTGAHDHF